MVSIIRTFSEHYPLDPTQHGVVKLRNRDPQGSDFTSFIAEPTNNYDTDCKPFEEEEKAIKKKRKKGYCTMPDGYY